MSEKFVQSEKRLPHGAKSGTGDAPQTPIPAPAWLTADLNVPKGTANVEREGSIVLDVPVETAYVRWTDFERLPEFLEGIDEVRVVDDGRLHWVADVGGKKEEWETEVDRIPNERISWRGVGGSANSGVVTFEPLGAGQTKVNVRLQTKGLWVGTDLERLKDVVENES